MRVAAHIAAAILATGCGDSGAPSPETTAGLEPSLEQAAGDRPVVATVDGVPIYADCVANQAAITGGDRDAALASCIEIELLVAEARRRGIATDPEVREAGEREMVRALIDREMYDTFQSPADVEAADVKKLWDRGLKNHFNRVEHRSVFYCRAQNFDPKTKKTPKGGEPDRKARHLAEAIWRRVKGRRDLERDELHRICLEVGDEVGGADVAVGDFKGFPRLGRAVPEFAEPSFAIPAIGMVSPPARTEWGYDLILLTEIVTPLSMSFEEAEPKIRRFLFDDPRYAGYRTARFERWLVDRTRDARVERFDENLPAPDPLARSSRR